MSKSQGKSIGTLSVLYEDENALIIDKPTGLLVHKRNTDDSEHTLVDILSVEYPDFVSVGEPILCGDGSFIKRYGIVHRLDKGTSGVLVIAKNTETFKFFKRQFHARTVLKEYHAFVHGTPERKRGTIVRPLIHHKTKGKRAVAPLGEEGRDACTEYVVKASIGRVSYIVCFPKTGRTHQIRVHMLSIGHPVIHDTLYAPALPTVFSFDRLALHSYRITLSIPKKGKMIFYSPFPEDFKKACNEIDGGVSMPSRPNSNNR